MTNADVILINYPNQTNKNHNQSSPYKLWLGNMEAAQDKQFLNNNHIKIVINVTPIDFIKFNGIKYYQIPLSDNDTDGIKKFLKHIDIIDTIEDKIKNNNILIHCNMGIQRSAAIVTAYLMKYHKMNIDEAIEYVISKRSIAFKSRVTFLEALYKFQLILTEK